MKHGGGGVMFWGCFGGGKVGGLKKITGNMDKDVYHQILVHHAMPSGNRLFSGRWIFMQDNDPKHTSGKVKAYLETKTNAKQSRMSVMNWPSQSPDLNPLEMLPELEQVVRAVWSEMPAAKMNTLVARMPHLCEAVLKADGGYFVEKM